MYRHKPITVIQMVERMEVGGLEQVIATLSRSLDNNRFQVAVWCLAGAGPLAEQLQQEGIAVRIFNISNYHHPAAIFNLAAALRTASPHVVHTHGYFAGVAGRLAAWLARVPVRIHHIHSTYYGYRQRNFFMEQHLASLSDNVICCSRAVADFARNTANISGAKIKMVHNGVAAPPSVTTDKTAIRQQFGLDHQHKIVLCVASLTPNKGHRFLIAAAARVIEKMPEARFLLLGDGPLKNELQAQCSDFGLREKFIFAGIRQDVRQLLPIGHCLVLPSHEREGLPVSIIEAMAAGLPVIGSRIGGIAEVIDHGRTGLLVPPADDKKLAAAILALITDTARRHTMGENGFLRYNRYFSARAMTEQIVALYEQALAITYLKQKRRT